MLSAVHFGNLIANGMPDGIWIVLLIIAGIVAYVLSNVVANMRKSEEQWQQVDKSKIKTWGDDDDW